MNSQTPRHPGLESLREGFCMLDPRWRVTYWNGAAERLFGIARGDALGRAPWDLVPGADEEGVRGRMAAAMHDRAAVSYTLGLELPGGRRELSVEVEPAEDGGVAVRVRDVADEARASARYLRLLETIRDGFIAVDGDWRIVYVNRVARRLLTIRRGALGAVLWSLLPGVPQEIGATLHATMADRAPRRLGAVRPEGRVFRGRRFDLWTDALPGGGISLLFQDVTEHLERERELARLAAEAEEASRSKSRFFAAVSHELRTPLNAIVGYTHLLAGSAYGPLPTGAERAAERAGICAEHLSRLVDDVLLLTTAETDRLPVNPRDVDLGEWLPAALLPLRMQAEAKGLAFSVRVAEGTPGVETDPDRLRQLLQAVVANAIKFTPRGSIRVAAGAARVGTPSEPGVELTVTDTGPGIPETDVQLIFGPFEQLGDPARHDTMRRGVGMGLTIARQIAHRLRGTLEADADRDAGATFRLRLPVVFRPAAGPAAPA